ncbi:aldehyde dehydrogenase family protein [Psychrobacillus sp. INOP01]|uniref:aldehyde dehydrogenase family protein n=1 Tax=Psychrobacillus sp. INOP01 TaxID=2829187 RepID=UPI001BA7E225|nr:aldehyde dehydrogenase family protein [Psychrobacillus sp. INOP01]QUG42589.1 aldehyde dehydrogenase family protein [Psychrobacillus sp. INOP01]
MVKQTKLLEIGHVINGEHIYEGETLIVENKFTNEHLATIYCADEEMVKKAVTNAKETFQNIKLSAQDRYEILSKAANILRRRKEELALSLTREVGKSLKDSYVEIDRGIETLIISAEESRRIFGQGVPLPNKTMEEKKLAYTVRVPVGVVAAITPFNLPFTLAIHKIAPAIAAGNTVVLKSAELAPITVAQIIDIFKEAGLPNGFINLVNGYGHKTGEYLLHDERINMYTFTGSVGVGTHIKNSVGVRKVTLELGSNSPNIIHKDAEDLKNIAQLCATRGLATLNGQACISVQRIYAHKDIFAEFEQYLTDAARALVVGNPEEVTTDVGPLISERQAERVESWIEEAVVNGAIVVTGGKRNRAFIEPTILKNLTPSMKVVCEEIFGPVISLIEYEEIDEVIKEANNSKFGLQAGLFTSDLNFVMRASAELEFGGVIVNDVSTYRSDWQPYGGVKDSGLGKEGPIYAIKEMTDEKVIIINYN